MQTSKPKGVAREAQRYELTGVPTSTWYDLQNAGLAAMLIPRLPLQANSPPGGVGLPNPFRIAPASPGAAHAQGQRRASWPPTAQEQQGRATKRGFSL